MGWLMRKLKSPSLVQAACAIALMFAALAVIDEVWRWVMRP